MTIREQVEAMCISGPEVRRQGDRVISEPYWARYNWDDPVFREEVARRLSELFDRAKKAEQLRRDVEGFRRVMGVR